MKKILRTFICIAVIANLSGCLYGQCMDGPCAFERAKMIENIKPYGAHWIKDGMTRESRITDWLQCGGGERLSDGYKDWLSYVPYEIYAQGKSVHIQNLTNCMQAKSYFYLEQCDARCLHP